MYLETDRLILRDFAPDDICDLHEILGDAETMRYCEPAYSFEQTRKFLAEFCIGKKSALAAVHKESKKVIGYLLFKPWEEGAYEIGWIFNKKFRRQGYAYEACSRLIDATFREGNIRRIVAETTDREKSVPLMEKLGMRLREVQKGQTDSFGERTDFYCCEITKE